MPQMIFRVAANLDEFRRNFAEMKAQAETTKVAMQRMANAFDGSKILADANAAVIQIEKLGGAAALTAKNQAKANAVLKEGLEQYSKMGPEAQKAAATSIAAMQKLEVQTRQVESRFGGLSGILGKLGPMLAATFSVGAATGAMRSLVTWADNLEEVSQGIGVNIVQLQKWQYAWATTGSSVEAGTKAIQTMSEKLSDGSADKAIARLGLDLEMIKRLAPEEQFRTITETLAGVTDQSKFAADGADIFGKTWKSVGVSVKNGMAEVAESANAMTAAQVKNLANLQAAWEGFSLQLKVFAGWAASREGNFLLRWWDSKGVAENPAVAAAKVGMWRPEAAAGFSAGGASDSEIRALDAALSQMARTAKAAAEALQALRVSSLVASIKLETSAQVSQRMIAGTALQSGAYFTGLPQGQFSTTYLDTAPLKIRETVRLTEDYIETIGDANKITYDWLGTLNGLGDQFVRLGQVAGGGGFGGIVQDIAKTIGGVEMAWGAGQTFKTASQTNSRAGQVAGVGAAAIQGITAYLQSTSSASRWGNIAGGAASGAAMGAGVGAAFGGVGAPWGAAIGGIAGAIGGAFRPTGTSPDKQIEEVHKALLSTYGSMEKVNKLGQQLGINMSLVWGAEGKNGLKLVTGLVSNLGDALERDTQFAASLGALMPGELMSRTLRSQMTGRLTDDSRAAVGQFITGQTGTLMDTVRAYVEGGGNLTGSAGRGMFSAAMAGVGQMRQNGMGLADIAASVSPWLGGLSAGTGMSNPLNDLLNTAARPEVGAILKSSDQLGTVAVTMANLGLMNKETFGDLTTGLSDSYQELLTQGVQGNDALKLMQPSLQQIYEMTKDYGYAADEATTLMLQQAEDQGLIGEAFRTTEEQLKLSIDALIASMNALNTTFGGVNPEGAIGPVNLPGGAGSGGRSGFMSPGATVVLADGSGSAGGGDYLPVSLQVDGDVLVETMVRVARRKGLA